MGRKAPKQVVKRKYTQIEGFEQLYRLGLIVGLEYGIHLPPDLPGSAMPQADPGWVSRANSNGFYITKTSNGVRHEEKINVDAAEFDTDEVIFELRRAIDQLRLR
jgi:hypothetical protein